jgi:hypothetical protein
MAKESALAPCPTCGKDIARSAKTCPLCGAKRKSGGWWWRLPLMIIFGIIGFIGVMNGASKVYHSHDAERSSTTTAANPTATLSADKGDIADSRKLEQLKEQLAAQAENLLPQCGSDDAHAMAANAIENNPNNPNIKVLDFKDFNPETDTMSPEQLQGVIHLEGLTDGAALLKVNKDQDSSLPPKHWPIKNTSTERHCFATVVTNAGTGNVRYRFFFSSKNEPLVEVTALR